MKRVQGFQGFRRRRPDLQVASASGKRAEFKAKGSGFAVTGSGGGAQESSAAQGSKDQQGFRVHVFLWASLRVFATVSGKKRRPFQPSLQPFGLCLRPLLQSSSTAKLSSRLPFRLRPQQQHKPRTVLVFRPFNPSSPTRKMTQRRDPQGCTFFHSQWVSRPPRVNTSVSQDPRRKTSSRPAHREVPNLQLIRPRERQEPPPLRLQSRLRDFDLLARLAASRLLRLRHPVLSRRLRRLQRKAAC